MKIADIVRMIEEIAPIASQSSWDKSGVQVACLRGEAKKMALCLDPLPDSIAQCLDLGAEFILAHHPLALKPELPNRDNDFFRALKLLLSADVCLYSAHTSLDINPLGPAGWFGRELGLKDCSLLEYVSQPDSTHPAGLGFGEIGSLPEEEESGHLCERVLEVLGLDNARLCGSPLPKKIDKIAYCGGSGGSLAEAAWHAGAQVFITGDIKYHTALDAPLPVLDVGHFSIENEMMRQMANLLRNKLRDMDIFFVSGKEPFRQFVKRS